MEEIDDGNAKEIKSKKYISDTVDAELGNDMTVLSASERNKLKNSRKEALKAKRDKE